jgi:predicted transport protein
LDHWNEDEIQKRAHVLTEQALKIWPMPQLDSSILQRYGTKAEDEALTYSEQDHFDYGSQTTNWLYDSLKSKVLAISNEIKVVPRKRYISFSRYTNFLDIVFYRNQLNLYLNIKKGSLEDPQKMTEDVTNTGHWGNGDYRIIIHDATDMEYLLSLIKQSFDKNYLLKNATSSEMDMNVKRTNVTYSENYHLEKCDNTIKDIYHQIKNMILSISPAIAVKANKYYIAFINRRNFIYLKTRRSKLELNLSLKKGELNDPKQIAIDMSTTLRHNPCEYTLIVDGKSDLVYIHSLIKQAYDKN